MIRSLLYKVKLKKSPYKMGREELLRILPLRNELIEWKEENESEVSLIITQTEKKWIRFLAKIFGMPPKRIILLDEIGSHVWLMADGNRSIRQIVQSLCDKYDMTKNDAETSLMAYMRQLGKRGIIGFAIPAKSVKKKD